MLRDRSHRYRPLFGAGANFAHQGRAFGDLESLAATHTWIGY